MKCCDLVKDEAFVIIMRKRKVMVCFDFNDVQIYRRGKRCL